MYCWGALPFSSYGSVNHVHLGLRLHVGVCPGHAAVRIGRGEPTAIPERGTFIGRDVSIYLQRIQQRATKTITMQTTAAVMQMMIMMIPVE